MLCEYGCGQDARYKTKGDGTRNPSKRCCSRSPNSCPINRRKNAESLKARYASGLVHGKMVYENLPEETKNRMKWNKGLTVDSDDRVRKTFESKKRTPAKGHKISKETKEKIRDARVRFLLSGKFDARGVFSYRGHYDKQFFHSSWELAFYVWNKEVNGKILVKNSTIVFEYEYNGEIKKYVPDFVDSDGIYYEVKGYVHSQRDQEKIRANNDKVVMIYKKDMKAGLDYCKSKYGCRFWENLYAPVVKLESTQQT